jgi:hypothetical protein
MEAESSKSEAPEDGTEYAPETPGHWRGLRCA